MEGVGKALAAGRKGLFRPIFQLLTRNWTARIPSDTLVQAEKV